MQQPEDIVHLYQEFGGRPDTYRELTRTRDAQQARERWPLISALGDLSAGVPPVRPGEAPGMAPQEWHAAQRPAPLAPLPKPTRGPVEPTGPLHAAMPATPVAAPVTPPAPPMWGQAASPAPVAMPAPEIQMQPLVPPPAPAQPPAAVAPVAGPALQSPSPLSRLARPAQPEAAPSTGLQQVFARLLGTRNRP